MDFTSTDTEKLILRASHALDYSTVPAVRVMLMLDGLSSDDAFLIVSAAQCLNDAMRETHLEDLYNELEDTK